MADNEQYNDEYQLADLDGLSPEPADAQSSTDEGVTFPEKQASRNTVGVKRNAVIGVAIFIFAIVTYKFLSSKGAEKKQPDMVSISTAKSTVTPPPASTAATITPPAPAQPVPAPIASEQPLGGMDSKIGQKLSALELSQQSMRDDVASVNNQLGGINNNMHEIMTKMAEVSRAVTNLSALADAQAHEMARLIVLKKAHKKPRHVSQAAEGTTRAQYYIQAVIPGRAWLVASNGNTLTVREGTAVVGYGIVKLIDPVQGRVMTSSGQVIRFSQEDS